VTGRLRLEGQVVSFDERVGVGEIDGQGGPGRRYRFHCTQIADGARLIGVGTRVSFGLGAGRDGRWEAADIRPTSDGPA
jgi:CspA family cold shock protein